MVLQMDKNSIVLALAAMCVVAADAAEYKRERYNLIVERSPFGADPMGVAQQQDQKNAAAETKAAEKELRLCFLLEAENGEVRAGFQNKAAKPGDPKSVILMVNESFKGMKLLSIDLLNSQATLDRNGTKVTFELSRPTPATVASKSATPQRRFGGGFRKSPSAPPAKPKEPELSPAEQAAKRAEVRENLRQYQMEVIRSGMPPLPIPLTPEMDDQLVSEGVLPPAE